MQSYLSGILYPKDSIGNAQTWDTLATRQEGLFSRVQFLKYKPHVLIANYAFLANVLSSIPTDKSVLKVIITHDVRHRRLMDLKKKTLHPLGESEWDAEKEAKQLHKAHLLLAIHQDDAEALEEMATPPCQVLSMPMPAVCRRHPSAQIPGRCLFVGSHANHNVHGLKWFLAEVWPLVLELVGNCCLHVCGTVCDNMRGTFRNVVFLGRIKALASEYGEAEACLIPLVFGSGLKIKLVEALSHGRACVSTPFGIQGLRELAGTAVMVAEEPQDFARAVELILANPDKRRHMEKQAHDFVRKRLSPRVVYKPLVDRIQTHLARVKNDSANGR